MKQPTGFCFQTCVNDLTKNKAIFPEGTLDLTNMFQNQCINRACYHLLPGPSSERLVPRINHTFTERENESESYQMGLPWPGLGAVAHLAQASCLGNH